VEYRKLGKWGVRVSEVALGSWLTYGGSVQEKESVEQIHYAFEQGINFFDTANVYAHGVAEQVIGKALSRMHRDDLFIATKVYFPMGNGPNDRGLSRKHVFEQCHASLKRLNSEYIDLYQCHRFDAETPMEELVRTMHDLTSQGKILYWGTSEWPASKIQEAVDTARELKAPPPVSNQPAYNMLYRDIEEEVIPVSEKNGLGQVIFSPLAQGVLTGKYLPGKEPPKDSRAAGPNAGFLQHRHSLSAENLEKVQELGKIAQELGISTAQLALSWILRLPAISAVIIGATKKSQIEENLKAAGVKLSPDVLARIETILNSELVRKS
jgi:voltage-dependent potassium channel beta subunit